MNAFETIVFLGLPKVGRKTVKKIIDRSLDTIGFNDPNDFINAVSEISPKVAEKLTPYDVQRSTKWATKILKDSEEAGITAICFNDERYPELLRKLGIDAPVILYVKGDLSVLQDKNKVAVIGTRNNSEYGEKAGTYITNYLVEKGYTIVSGLAIGCDTIGHNACLTSRGKTIAVMAGGLDSIYPKENKNLADEILHNGCLITEYPIGTRSLANYFVERDRIQSGLSLGIVVIETNIKGGTLHTVKFGLNQGRSVSCIKYNDDINLPSNAGNKMLIDEGKVFPLSSENIDSYIETFKNVPFPVSDVNKPTKKLKVKYKKSTKINSQNQSINTTSKISSSDPDAFKQINKNVLVIKELNDTIENLKNELKKFGGQVDGQTAMFNNSENVDNKKVELLNAKIQEIERQKKQLIQQNKDLLATTKNMN